MNTSLLIILGVVVAGALVRIIKIFLAKDKSQQAMLTKQLNWGSMGLLVGYAVYIWALMYAPAQYKPSTKIFGIILFSIQGARFLYKFWQLRKLKKEAGFAN